MCEQIFKILKININNKKQNMMNSLTIEYPQWCSTHIERSGIQIHNETFKEHFYPVDGKPVYTQFNLKTTTTRPSNKFKNVNYAALNKENGCRKSFIPSNDCLYEIDISSFSS